ncbi:MAG: helix-turn-helix domain-containing protein [Planctomycetaceae bacterium]|nr:helix-turn-helix domain-containing protein [Planctomycetaceae bacterium]
MVTGFIVRRQRTKNRGRGLSLSTRPPAESRLPHQSLTAQQRALALDLYTQRKHTVGEICRTLGISKPTL